ncbi:hypothetical protein ACHAXR_011800, partial [Thalassiosira sp. AJA248-18]
GGRRSSSEEEEKVEEGLSVSTESDEEMGYNNNSRVASRGGVASGVPVTSSQTSGDSNALFTRGGGDVRSRPPPTAAQQQAALDPLRQAEIAKQKNKKNVNDRYADLHETGQWGGLSKWEKYGICLLTLGAIVAAIVLGIQFGSGGPKTPEPTMQPTKSPTMSPSTSPTMNPTDVEYREYTGLELMDAASPKLTLPQTPEELVGAKTREDSTPQELAAEFVLYDDPQELPARDPRFMERYALAVFYYQNGGCVGDWITKSNWLTGDHCHDNWHGIVCDLKNRTIAVNLSKNFITGKIPIEFAQLMELSTLDLSNNAMVGPVPAEALSLRNMFTIQLNNNKLTGEFPFQEVKEGAIILDNLWIQENPQLSGTITESYCQLNTITLDCDNFITPPITDPPQPVYPVEDPTDSGYTNFELNCLVEAGRKPSEYTCNFDDPEPFTKSPVAAPTNVFGGAPTPAICGTPAVGS